MTAASRPTRIAPFDEGDVEGRHPDSLGVLGERLGLLRLIQRTGTCAITTRKGRSIGMDAWGRPRSAQCCLRIRITKAQGGSR
jgi:hypothetical protein